MQNLSWLYFVIRAMICLTCTNDLIHVGATCAEHAFFLEVPAEVMDGNGNYYALWEC